MSGQDILALGEPLIEMVRCDGKPDGPASYKSDVGGDALNALVAAARQGARTGLLSAVGDDPFGSHIRNFCMNERIETSNIKEFSQVSTGVCFIHPDPEARHFTYARQGSAASCYSVEDLPLDAIAKSKILHITGVTQAISPSMREAAFKAAQTARANGTLVSYDLNLRLKLWSLGEARACISDFLPLASIVLPSDDEAETLIGTRNTDEILEYFSQYGADFVCLKRAARGVILRTQQAQIAIGAPTVEAIDSSGAGDSFAGAFLAYLLETNDPKEAATRAAHVAAKTVMGHGATAAIPSRDDILGLST